MPSGSGPRSSPSNVLNARTRRATTSKATVSTTRRRPTSGRTDWSGSSQPLCSTSPQTEGEPLPELETEATGMPKTWFPCSSARRTISMSRFASSTLPTGSTAARKGVCKYRSKRDLHPVVEAKARPNQADLAVTLIHEYAHALCSIPTSTTRPSGRNVRSRQKPSRTSSGGISTWIRAGQRSILPRGRATMRRAFRNVSGGSVRPHRRSSTRLQRAEHAVLTVNQRSDGKTVFRWLSFQRPPPGRRRIPTSVESWSELYLSAVLDEAERVAEQHDQIARSADDPAHEYLRYAVLRLLEGETDEISTDVPGSAA